MTIKGSLQGSIPIVKAFLTRNRVIWRIDRENRCSGLGCRRREKKQKKTSRVTGCTFSHISGAKRSNRIVMKFCIGVRVPDVITNANLGDNRFRRFCGRSNFSPFHWLALLSLKYSGTTVPACDRIEDLQKDTVQDAQLSQRPRCRVRYSFRQK